MKIGKIPMKPKKHRAPSSGAKPRHKQAPPKKGGVSEGDYIPPPEPTIRQKPYLTIEIDTSEKLHAGEVSLTLQKQLDRVLQEYGAEYFSSVSLTLTPINTKGHPVWLQNMEGTPHSVKHLIAEPEFYLENEKDLNISEGAEPHDTAQPTRRPESSFGTGPVANSSPQKPPSGF